MGTVNIASLGNAQSIGFADASINRDASGALALGNFVFNVDQTVGAGQDNYVLTYNHSTGEIELDVAAGGGLANVVEDTTPQLGGTLNANNNKILNMNLGTVSLPAIVPTGDTDSGIYWVTATNMAVSVGGAERFRFGSTGVFSTTSGITLGPNSVAPDVYLGRLSSTICSLFADLSGTSGASHELHEMTAPSAPASNRVRIYAEDNGSGKTRLMALFATGAAQQIAIEP